jgi:hypothetical protein
MAIAKMVLVMISSSKLGTGRNRPLANSKQATNEKPRPEGGSRRGEDSQLALTEKAPNGSYHGGRETDVRHLPDYAPIHEAKLVASLDQIQNAKRTLGPHDRLLIETDDRTYEVDLSKTWVPSESIQVADTQLTETHSDGELILTIRKADLLGQAMWQFSHGKTSIYVPIKDEAWLKDFHDRRIALYSGDALRCKVKFTFVYDDKGVLIEQKIEIIKVLDVIKGSGGNQLGLTL